MLGICNALLLVVALYASLANWNTRAVLFPLCVAIAFYSLWPVSEQLFFDVHPAFGEPLSDDSLLEASLTIAMVFAVVLAAGRLLAMVRSGSLSRPMQLIALSEAELAAASLMIATGIALLYVVTDFEPLRLAEYEQNILASQQSVWLPLSKSIIAYGCGLVCVGAVVRLRLQFSSPLAALLVAAAVLPVSLAFLTSDKDPVLPIAAAFVLTAAGVIRRTGLIGVALGTCAGAVCSFLFLLYFSSYRGGGGLVDVVERLANSPGGIPSITGSDPGGPYVSLAHELNLGIPPTLQLPVADRLLSAVPKGFAGENRPDGLDVVYAKFALPSFDAGKGLGFHPLAESHIDFGPAFAWSYVAILLAFAIVPLAFVNRLDRTGAFSALTSLLVFSCLLTSHRMTLVSTAKAIAAQGVVLLLVFAACRICSGVLGSLFSTLGPQTLDQEAAREKQHTLV